MNCSVNWTGVSFAVDAKPKPYFPDEEQAPHSDWPLGGQLKSIEVAGVVSARTVLAMVATEENTVYERTQAMDAEP